MAEGQVFAVLHAEGTELTAAAGEQEEGRRRDRGGEEERREKPIWKGAQRQVECPRPQTPTLGNNMTHICSTPSSCSHLQALLSSYHQHGFRKCFTISHLHYSENLKLHKTLVMP